MELIDLKVPTDYAKKILVSELNSYAYSFDNQVLIYLREFAYGESGGVQAGVEMYPVVKENPIVANFTRENPLIPNMKVIDTDSMEIPAMNQLMINLMTLCANTTCVKTNAPIFDKENIPTVEDNDCNDEQKYPYGPGIKPEPGDIVIPIPKDPPHFENPGKFDEE